MKVCASIDQVIHWPLFSDLWPAAYPIPALGLSLSYVMLQSLFEHSFVEQYNINILKQPTIAW